MGLETTWANADADIATSITSATTNGIHATRGFIGWVVLFRPRRHPIVGGLSRTSTARRLVLPLSSPTSRALTTARPTVPKRQRRDAGGESSRRVTGAEDAAEGVREWGLALEERGGYRSLAASSALELFARKTSSGRLVRTNYRRGTRRRNDRREMPPRSIRICLAKTPAN